MINWKIIWKIISQLLMHEAVMMLYCLGLAIYKSETSVWPFIISIGIMLAAASGLKYAGWESSAFMRRRESYLVVSLVWVVYSLFGALPFLIGGYISNPVDAFFETMSGFTTTGATIIDDVEVLPSSLLFWRSMTQWIGGLGIVFFTIAIIPSLVGGSVQVFSAEATGPVRDKVHPRLSTTGKWIWGIYVFLTATCTAAFYLEGMSFFDSVNYAMTVTATGGFATHNASTGYFHSVAIDYTAIFYMFFSGVSFSLLYFTVFKRRFRDFFRNSELRLYLTLIGLATVGVMYFLMSYNHYSLLDALRYGLFQVVSFITTTGVFNDDAAQWHHVTWVILCVCMFFGGCSGSTSGGFKCVRGVMVLSLLRNELRRLLHPNAVMPMKVNGNTIPTSQQSTLMAFFSLYMILCLFTYFVMILTGIDSTNSFTIALSCASNVGPTLGLEIGPTMSWSILPDAIKLLLSLLMLMGRLEIMTVIVIFTRSFWTDK